MPIKQGHSKEVVSSNISELRKSGKPLNQSIAIALSSARKSRKMMAEGGIIEPGENDVQYPTMEPDMNGPNKVQSMGQEESDARDVVDQGTEPKPSIPSNVEKTSPDFISPEMRELIKRRKMKYSSAE